MFMPGITPNQFFSNSKEGLGPKGQMFPTIIQTQESISGDYERAENLPGAFSGVGGGAAFPIPSPTCEWLL